jgi:nucleotide-binding universal stress UspA family protein
MFERILFPLDFSEQSMRMFDCLLELKHLGTKEVIICHVTPPGQGLTDEQSSTLGDLEKNLMDAGIRATVAVRSGDAIAQVLDVAEREAVSLIAMASSGKGRAREFIVGSTSFGILRSSTIPVLINKFKVTEKGGRTTVAAACRSIFRKALVPIDFSSCTDACMELLPRLSVLGLQEAVLFHVVESTRAAMDDEVRFRKVLDDVMAKLEGLRLKLVEQGCNASTHVHFGTVSYNILEASRELDTTLIILGAHRKSLLREIALGGNSETVVRRSHVPLLVIPYER